MVKYFLLMSKAYYAAYEIYKHQQTLLNPLKEKFCEIFCEFIIGSFQILFFHNKRRAEPSSSTPWLI